MRATLFAVALLLLSLCPEPLSAQTNEWKLMHRGNSAFTSGNYDRAEKFYMDAVKKNPQNIRALFNLADTYLAKGDAHNADSLFAEVGKREANDQIRSMAFHNRGFIRQYMALSDEENQQQLLRDAIEQYKEALRLNPSDDDTRYNLALCQKQLKDSEQNPNQQQQQQQEQSQQDPSQQPAAPEQEDSKQDPQQTEQYLNLSRQAEKRTLQKLKQSQPRQKKLDKNW